MAIQVTLRNPEINNRINLYTILGKCGKHLNILETLRDTVLQILNLYTR